MIKKNLVVIGKKNKDLLESAFLHMNKIIDRNIIGNCRCLEFSKLTSDFRDFLLELYKANYFAIYKGFKYNKTLKKHIHKNYKKQVRFCMIQEKEFLCPIDIHIFNSTEEVTLDDAYKAVAKDKREACLNVPVKKLPNLVTMKDLITGECLELPNKVENFVKNILVGARYRQKNVDSERTNRLANAVTQDLVYTVNRGRIKTAK